jgi:hypothetical protein
MWNPFKKEYINSDEFWESLITLTEAVLALQASVKELREEVDYLVDFLDD